MNFVLRQLYEENNNEQIANAQYLQAVQNEDLYTLKELLDFQREKNGYFGQFYSGSLKSRGDVYKRAAQNGIWCSPSIKTAKEYAVKDGNQQGDIREMAIKLNNPLDLRPLGIQNTIENIYEFLESNGISLPQSYYREFKLNAQEENQDEWFVYSIIDGRNFKTDRGPAIQEILKSGYDGLILKDTHWQTQSDSYVLFQSNQVKLNGVTRDPNGRIVPLNERYDEHNENINY
jgi:hypothetical protein